MIRWLTTFALCIACVGVMAVEELKLTSPMLPSLPQWAAEKHLGNVTCGNSFCHEAQRPWKTSSVLQNEYLYWEEHDPHAKSYKTLKGKKSQAIAEKLKIGDPSKASTCLDCHANNAPESNRARTFDIADGVSCEACHGPAGKWLGVHVSGAGYHADNVAAGMYPTEDPLARAELCASCHVGNSKKFVSHELYSAGHPLTPFELNTFTNSAAHFITNDEYAKRKRVVGDVQAWALGLVITLRNHLDGIADPSRFRKRMIPELAYFDCYSCHREMSGAKNKVNAQAVLVASPQLNDVNNVIILALLEVTDQNLAVQFSQQTAELKAAPLKSFEATEAAAKALRSTVDSLTHKIASREFADNDLPKIFDAISVRVGKIKELTPPVAIQTVLAMTSLLDAMKKSQSVPEKQYVTIKEDLRKLHKSLDQDSFNTVSFRTAINQIKIGEKLN
jgi:Cytochrome c554 and c-prime